MAAGPWWNLQGSLAWEGVLSIKGKGKFLEAYFFTRRKTLWL